VDGRPGLLSRLGLGRAGPGQRRSNEVLVIGLGRFGSALARELIELGHEVLAVDNRAEIVQRYANANVFTQSAIADTTSSEALRQLGAAEFEQAVVAIGSDVQASILTSLALVELGVPNVWAKAITQEHFRILQKIGVHHVVLPEAEMGRRVAHLVTNRMIDYIELDDDFSLVEIRTPRRLVGQTLGGARIRSDYGVTVVCVKPSGGRFRLAQPDDVLGEGDLLLIAGDPRQTDAFSQLDE
jgi:trk system potassium uptake protein TrkA